MATTQPSAMPLCPVEKGDLVDGKYRIEEVLGFGGAGVVVAARHDVLDQRVAIKMLHHSPQQRPKAVARLLREARAASRLRSAHVPRVYDVGTLDNGSPFIVMDWLIGEDLGKHLDRRGSLPVSEAVDYVLQACDAVSEAHVQGIVHRDLKPQNLFLTESGVVKVLDFGISKMWEENDAGLTATGAVMGTPRYMSPEQLIDPSSADARSDIWSLGVILYELVTGRHAFQAAYGDTPDLRGIPQPVAGVIARCLKKERERRFADVGELVRALHPAPANRKAWVAAALILVAGGVGVYELARPGEAPKAAAAVSSFPPVTAPSPPPRPAEEAPRLEASPVFPVSSSVSSSVSNAGASTARHSPSGKPARRGDELELDSRF